MIVPASNFSEFPDRFHTNFLHKYVNSFEIELATQNSSELSELSFYFHHYKETC